MLALITILASLPMIVLGTAGAQLVAGKENLYWNAAYEAAQAGLNDYVQNLDADETFAQWSSGYGYSQYCTAPYPAGNSYDAAFCGWVALNTTGVPLECYEYSLPSVSGGALTLTVSGEAVQGTQCTGWPSGQGVLRTFVYRLAPQNSFLDDIYWTNYESEDPLFPGCSGDGNAQAPPNDGNWYQGATNPCTIWFFGNGTPALDDTINGPLFSNDTLMVLGTPTFNGPVYSAAGSSRTLPNGTLATTEPLVVAANGYHTACAGDNGTPSPTWADGCPQKISQQIAPSTAADKVAAQNVGCYITGLSSGNPVPTWVDLTMSTTGAVTTLTWSSDAAAPTPAVVHNAAANPNTCANPITVNSANMKSALFYVNGNISIHGSANGFLTVIAGDDNGVGPGNSPKSSAQAGKAGYVTVNGNITYPAGHITGPAPTTETDTSDGLGIIAQHFIGIQNTLTNPTIDSALLAVDGSVMVQNFDVNTAASGGTLTIFGSMAQDFRGPVATSNGGDGSRVWLHKELHLRRRLEDPVAALFSFVEQCDVGPDLDVQ